MIRAGDELSDRGVELGEGEPRRARRPAYAPGAYPGRLGKSSRRDRAEQPLKFPASLRHSGGGMHQLDVQIDTDLIEMPTGEVRAVVGVEHSGMPAHRPAGIALTPDRLPQRQARSAARSAPRGTPRTRDRAAMVILDHRQPRPRRTVRTRGSAGRAGCDRPARPDSGAQPHGDSTAQSAPGSAPDRRARASRAQGPVP